MFDSLIIMKFLKNMVNLVYQKILNILTRKFIEFLRKNYLP